MDALFGRYAYAGELGRGATGRVLRALDSADGDAQRAIKVVPELHAARLVWEFARLGQIAHPRVARVRELLRVAQDVPAPFSLPRGALLLVEDWVAGEPLTHAMRAADDAKARLLLAANVSRGIGEALSALHAASLVHGDVKPDNVLCDARGEGATLIDLGFARPPTLAARPRGTPAYMAPELFAGACTKAADVYALGALLYDCLRGEPPASQVSAGEAPWRVPDLTLLSDVDARVLALLAQLLAPTLEQRPADAEAALALVCTTFAALGLGGADAPLRGLGLARSAQERAERACTLPLIGHAAELDALVRLLGSAARVLVRGPAGAGRTRLVREALRKHQQVQAEAGAPVPTWVRSLDALTQLRDVAAVLWLDADASPELAHVLQAASLTKLSLRGLCVVITCGPALACEDAACVTVAPLSASECAHLLAALLAPDVPGAGVVEAARSASLGLSGRLCSLASQVLLAGSDPSDVRVWAALGVEPDDVPLSPPARALAEALAWWGGALRPEQAARALRLDDVQRAYEELQLSGLLRGRGHGTLDLVAESVRAVRARSRPRARGIVEALAAVHADVAPEQAPFVQLAYGDCAAAAAAFVKEARRLRALGHGDVDDPLLRRLLADSERAAGRYERALAVLDGAEDDESGLARVELLRLSDRAQAAEVMLDTLVQRAAPSLAARARGLRARAAFDRGALDEALRDSELAASAGDLEAEVRALEVQVLSALQAGTLAQAPIERLLARATGAAQDERQAPAFLARAAARAHALGAQVRMARGERVRAVADLRLAVQQAGALGEAHEAATYALNLALSELERGELGSALEALRALSPRLARFARPRDLARVLLNLAGLCLLVGDVPRAELALSEAAPALAAGADPAAQAVAAVLRAELALERGALDAATRMLEVAFACAPADARTPRALVAARAAQVAAASGALASARGWLSEAASCSSPGEAGLRLELLTAGMRVALADADHAEAETLAREGLAALDDRVAFPERLRFVIAAVECARVAHPVALGERTALARGWLEQALVTLPPAQRASLRAVPAYARVLGAPREPAATHAASEGRWRELVRASRRLFAEPRAGRVAQRVAEIALELVQAERALVITFDADYALRVVARAELAAGRATLPSFSRSVVERVALEGKPLMTIEARSDERLDRAVSVHTLSLRSVLCVALSGLPERAFLYLDDRLRPSAFGLDDLALLLDLAELAREALASAVQLKQAAGRARRAEHQQRRLSKELSLAQRAAATGSASVPLIGASPLLGRLLSTARKVALSDAPVLIQGESGTGKELLARYLHDVSPRKQAAFVAESCAALPDTLLESALFGHVRGAFTGAERAHKGLFEIADGGTLFLDEVGEMSAALQAKLLRVLQEGELRPLGSERTRSVDVRVLCATRRDLLALVRAGSFREDLYYRLAVVTLELPSLRARPEDIAVLVAHFVEKHAAGRNVRIHSSAIELLEQRAWPGNVRELENVLRRALVLCESEITPAHLALHEAATGSEDTGELDLHARTEQLTRLLVERAMERAAGNVTRAAALLGVSRFGLQKMLKRYPRAK